MNEEPPIEETPPPKTHRRLDDYPDDPDDVTGDVFLDGYNAAAEGIERKYPRRLRTQDDRLLYAKGYHEWRLETPEWWKIKRKPKPVKQRFLDRRRKPAPEIDRAEQRRIVELERGMAERFARQQSRTPF
jgi:hypothetical protein